jgi:hypothetical protein
MIITDREAQGRGKIEISREKVARLLHSHGIAHPESVAPTNTAAEERDERPRA